MIVINSDLSLSRDILKHNANALSIKKIIVSCLPLINTFDPIEE